MCRNRGPRRAIDDAIFELGFQLAKVFRIAFGATVFLQPASRELPPLSDL